MTEKDRYGPITVTLDHDSKQAEISLKRWNNPLSDKVIERLRQWALSVTEADYPDYQIIDKAVMHGKD